MTEYGGIAMLTTGWSREDFARLETLYHNANGYLGVRNSPEEGCAPGGIRGAYINGFYELIDIAYDEKFTGFPDTKQTLVNVQDAQTILLEAGERTYSMFDESVTGREQALDMDAGVSLRSSLWNTERGALRLRFTRMASFENPNLFLLRCELRSEGYEGPLTLRSRLNGEVSNFFDPDDPRLSATALRPFETLKKGGADGRAWWVSRTRRSGLTLACHVGHVCRWEGAFSEAGGLEWAFSGTLRDGESLALDKYVVYADSRYGDDPDAAARENLSRSLEISAEDWLKSQRAYMRALREKAFVRLDAGESLARALEFDLFQLEQSTGWDAIRNVAAKGLSGEGYEGHTFWDSEVYIFPFFLWTQPEKARGMLTYRHAMLDKARDYARLLGFEKGALYPWRTINGDECSAFFPAGTAQYHINGDIAYAFLQYWWVTGDAEFMAERGAEVLVETARFWLSLGHMEEDGFRIDCVTGPDEYTCLVNNNFYTNAIAQYNLRGAALVLRALKERGMDGEVVRRTGLAPEEIERFEETARRMYLPRDERLGISPQDDSFLRKKRLDLKAIPRDQFPLLLHTHPLYLYRHQVCKQADTVLAHLLFPETADPETIRRSYHYYDEVTTHDSSLSVCIYGMVAARLGLMDRAVRSFATTACMDIDDINGNTKDGLHTASLGGAYLSMLLGFGGIRATEAGLSVDPVLPEGWEGYGIPFAYRGRRLLLTIRRGQEPSLELLSGEPLEALWKGRRIELK